MDNPSLMIYPFILGAPSPRDLACMLYNYNMLNSDIAAMSLNSTCNGLIPPAGGPTSPRSNGVGKSNFS